MFHTFFLVKGFNFRLLLRNPQKALPWSEQCMYSIITYFCGGAQKYATCGFGLERPKRKERFHVTNWLFARAYLPV